MLLYATICDIIKLILGDTKIPFVVKKEVQVISNSLKGEIGMQYLTLQFRPLQSQVFDQVSLATMAEAQTKDAVLGLVIPYICKGKKLEGLVISKLRCKAVHKYLLQFHYLILKQGVLHQIYITNDVETHQLVLPEYITKLCFVCYTMTMVIRDSTRHWL